MVYDSVLGMRPMDWTPCCVARTHTLDSNGCQLFPLETGQKSCRAESASLLGLRHGRDLPSQQTCGCEAQERGPWDRVGGRGPSPAGPLSPAPTGLPSAPPRRSKKPQLTPDLGLCVRLGTGRGCGHCALLGKGEEGRGGQGRGMGGEKGRRPPGQETELSPSDPPDLEL